MRRPQTRRRLPLAGRGHLVSAAEGPLEVGVSTLEQLGDLDAPPEIEGLGADALANTHAQARIQLKGRRSGRPEWEFREPERDEEGALVPNRGLLILPEPAEGDLFFDIEGARYYSEDGKTSGCSTCSASWTRPISMTTASPATARSGRSTGTREGWLRGADRLLHRAARAVSGHARLPLQPLRADLDRRALDAPRHDARGRGPADGPVRAARMRSTTLSLGVFVDLYRVVRQGIRASVESYSIKRLEEHIGYTRKVALADVNERIVLFEAALDDGTAADDTETREIIRGYNEDDCRATLALRDWLEARRADLETELGEPLPRPVPPEPPEDQYRSRDRAPAGSAPRWACRRMPGERTRDAARPGTRSRPARVAPTRGQAQVVALLPPAGPERRGTPGGRRRAGRSDVRRVSSRRRRRPTTFGSPSLLRTTPSVEGRGGHGRLMRRTPSHGRTTSLSVDDEHGELVVNLSH